MNKKTYDRRITKARAARDSASECWFPEHFYQARIGSLFAIVQRLRAERDAARLERDKALRAIARLAMMGVAIPKDE